MGRPVRDNDEQLLALDALGGKIQRERRASTCGPKMADKYPWATASAQQVLKAFPGGILCVYILVRSHADDKRDALTVKKRQPVKALSGMHACPAGNG